MNTMSEPNGESKKVGRPTVYSGPEGPVYEAFETHLNKIAGNCKRRRSCDRRLFADIGDLKSPKYDKIKVHLKFLLELAKIDPHWNFILHYVPGRLPEQEGDLRLVYGTLLEVQRQVTLELVQASGASKKSVFQATDTL